MQGVTELFPCVSSEAAEWQAGKAFPEGCGHFNLVLHAPPACAGLHATVLYWMYVLTA